MFLGPCAGPTREPGPRGDPPDYSSCDAKLSDKWADAETQGGGMCPTNGDLASMQARITTDADDIADCLNGTCPPPACQLFPATGQTTCWDSSGTVIPCPGTGHDGDIQAGATLAYMDNGDGTITDLNTGLMWEKKSDDGSINDKDNVYSWALGEFVDLMRLGRLATTSRGGQFAGGGLVSIPVAVAGPLRSPAVTPMSAGAVGGELMGLMKKTANLPIRLIRPLLPGKKKD